MGIKTIGYPLVRQTGEISPESAIKIYGLFGIQFEILAHIFSVVHFFQRHDPPDKTVWQVG